MAKRTTRHTTEPKTAVAGKPAGQIGKYEIKQTASRVGYTALGMVFMAVKLIAQFANTQNVGDMITTGGYWGGAGLMVIGFCVMLVKRMSNNTNKA